MLGEAPCVELWFNLAWTPNMNFSFVRNLAVFLGMLGRLIAQAPGAAETSFPDPFQLGIPAIQTFSEREGLPHPTVHALAMDVHGRLWAGTQDGAAYLSGKTWKPVEFPAGCGSRFIRAVAATPDGSVWFGTQDDGLWQLQEDRWVKHGPAQGLPARRINHLQWRPEASGFSLWVATADTGVARYQHGTWTTWGIREGLRHPWVWKVRPVASGTWVAGFGGLAFIEKGRLLPDPSGAVWVEQCNDILDLRGADGSGELLLSSWNRGLLRRVGGRWTPEPATDGFTSTHPVALAATTEPDGTQILWAGTYESGLAWKRGQGRWVLLTPEKGFPSSGVFELLVDPRGKPALWVGMRQAGLAALDPSGWTRLNPRMLGPARRVQSLVWTGPLGQETFWIGTEQGIFHWSKNRWIADSPGKAFPSTLVYAVLTSTAWGSSRVLAGTLDGLAERGPGGWRLLPPPDGMQRMQVMALLERQEQGSPALWVGMEGGLARYHRGRWSCFTSQDGLPDNWVYTLVADQDRDGGQSLWIGTRRGGVARWHAGTWTSFGTERGLPPSTVYSLLLEPLPGGKRRLWAGTDGGGLAWIDPDRPEARWGILNLSTVPALPSDAVLRLDRDGDGRLFAMTNRGVVMLQGPPEVAPGPRWQAISFTEGDGLPSRVCTHGASMVDSTGRLWVGTAAGIAVLDPRRVTTPPPPSMPNLNGVQVGGHAWSLKGPLELPYDHEALSFEFSLPVFHRVEDVRYRTQILGLEKSPTHWNSEDRRELTGIRAGKYVLRIQARDHLGRESPYRDFAFRIRPAPWRTATAYVIYGLVVAGLAWVAHRVRIRMLEAKNRTLRAKVFEATHDLLVKTVALEVANQNLVSLNETKTRMLGVVAHDLRNPLTAILMGAQLLECQENTPCASQEMVQKIQRSAEFMHGLLQRFLDLETIERGKVNYVIGPVDLRTMIESLRETHGCNATGKGMELSIEIPEDLPPMLADAVCLRTVLDNLLSNAIKFTAPGPPLRRVTLAAGPGWVEVRDQGPGLNAEDQARAFGQFVRLSARPTAGEGSIGLGLAIVKSLVTGMGGEIELESEPGSGTCIRVRLPVASMP